MQKENEDIRRVILASGSPRRRELLTQIGIVHEVIPSGAEELTEKERPEDVVMELSCRKASDIGAGLEAGGEDGYTVIGADTVVSFQDMTPAGCWVFCREILIRSIRA